MQTAVERFGKVVLPRARRSDVTRRSTDLCQPRLQLLGDELRAVVSEVIIRQASHREHFGSRFDQVLTLDIPRRLQGETLEEMLCGPMAEKIHRLTAQSRVP